MMHACFQTTDSWSQCLSFWRASINALPLARRASSRVLLVPPDITRAHSGAAELMQALFRAWPQSAFDILPALGTHRPMTSEQLRVLYGALPAGARYLCHDWRNDTREIGILSADEIASALGFPVRAPWRIAVNRALLDNAYDLVLSIGQVVPHEVLGMSNYTKNIIIGLGGMDSINLTHYWSAQYGMRRILGVAINPLRTLLQTVADRYLSNVPIWYAMTVMQSVADAASADASNADTPRSATVQYRPYALVVGRDMDAFSRAARYSQEAHIISVPHAIDKAVVYMPPQMYRSLWVANKAIYRLGGVMAKGGELVIIADIDRYAEDSAIETLIAKYGYANPDRIHAAMLHDASLRRHGAAAAHILHSAHKDFTVRFALPPAQEHLITRVGFQYMPLADAAREYGSFSKQNGWYRSASGERYYFAYDPAHYLWRIS